jgi:pSer/pThr/pTyr-binding forkhead associated (FHA) protein
MHDGRTRKVNAPMPAMRAEFLESHKASLTVLRGPAAGTEFELEAARVVVGRSHTADLVLDDASVSSEHAAIELDAKGFGIRDLASTNGVHVNGAEVLSAELKHGDRVVVGNCELQYVLEERTRPARAWSVED